MYPIQGINGTLVIFPFISGYLNFTHGAFHYVFFDSQRDPDNDPVILWLNGGPGCSSLIGMVYENGPFVFLPDSTELVPNEHAWNKKANLLYITSPQGVTYLFILGWIQYWKSIKTG
jgi:carboxypeptidase C (cathepsin A)